MGRYTEQLSVHDCRRHSPKCARIIARVLVAGASPGIEERKEREGVAPPIGAARTAQSTLRQRPGPAAIPAFGAPQDGPATQQVGRLHG